MALETYRAKRDFSRTPEPEPAAAPATASPAPRYAVQKHAARRLHYDLRLEHDGVLWSWAVTRGPSLDPGERRLAVRTEDHPLDYAEFEGVIPKGGYGAGTVMLWDRGSWEPTVDPVRGMAKGHLEFALKGERLRGRWRLVRMAGRAKDKSEPWLLIKSDDAAARAGGETDVLLEYDVSALSGRDMEAIARGDPQMAVKARKRRRGAPKDDAATDAAPHARVKGSRKAAFPDFIPPALATLRAEAPRGDDWIHEIKFDGYRLQAQVRSGGVRLLTRTGLDWTDRFAGPLRDAFAALPAAEAVIDGEVVVEAAGGASDFGALQADLAEGRADRFAFYAIDLLHLDGRDLRPARLEDRKGALERLLADAPSALRYGAHFADDGEVVLRHACRLSLEGVVSKRRAAPYRSGRTKDWIKSKCLRRQEFVVLGYAPNSADPAAVGALLLGYRRDGRMIAAGRVGTGFGRGAARRLAERLAPMERPDPAGGVTIDAATRRAMRFVEPETVVEVEFLDWTTDGLVRHASFRGLREDKPAAEVVREEAPDDAPARRRPGAPRPRLTSPDRVYWPDDGLTKAGLADWYAAAWRRMAPHLVRRPLALLRCPDGIAGPSFFQKHAWRGQSGAILTRADPRDDDGDPSLIAVDSLEGLFGLVQGAALEIHGWQASIDALETPDQLVFDLDPDAGVGPEALREAAREVRARLEAAGLAAFLKTSGGKGYHVVTPLAPKAGWDEAKAFAKRVAAAMEADAPARYTAVMSKARRKGRVFVDYLRNGRGSTAVLPYSTRARPGAAISAPLAWDELDTGPGPADVAATDAGRSLEGPDPWEDFRAAAAPLPAVPDRKPRAKSRR